MRIHLNYLAPTTCVYSEICEKELAFLIDLARRGISLSFILVKFRGRLARVDVRDIDVSMTLPTTIFPRVSVHPPAA